MDRLKENADHFHGIVLFIILFSIFLLNFSGKSEGNSSVPVSYTSHNEMACENISKHSDAIVVSGASAPVLFENYLSEFHNTGLNLSALKYSISGFNHNITLEYNNFQEISLKIKPILHRRLYYPSCSGEKDPVPLLS